MRPELFYTPLAALIPPARNARVHTKTQLNKIAESLKVYGFISPIVIDAENRIVVGVARVEAAKMLGLTEAPAVRVTHLSDVQLRAYRLADNRLAEDGRWDTIVLAEELLVLSEQPIELVTTGFELAEIDRIVLEADEAKTQGADDALDETPDLRATAVSRPGDVWSMEDGRHRLICGDALQPETFYALMPDGEVADMVFTDAPYNVPIQGFVGGSGRIKQREFAMASGEMSPQAFLDFLTQVHVNLAAKFKDGAIAFSCMDWRGLSTLEAAAKAAGFEVKNLIVWDKGVGAMGTFYRSQHELILALKWGEAGHTNTFGLGDTGRSRTNVWACRGVSGFGKDRMEAIAMHPTVKPVSLVKEAILDVSRRGEIVLDAFGGSGTTLIAAHKAGRRSRLVEIDPLYCDTICRRWIALTGRQPIRQDGLTFEAAEAEAMVAETQPTEVAA